ncbi:hypothetical protein DI272_00040 [Streptomyces sp. Act143]|uniref:hypothetical protein n=1 Tax=Streptomyces sp. Act143 TaxID=2200760 RepID=UPI000D679178|nr:hypothetical protein [Streptomyces sp. Act143]PWI12731.1 hypothetical protein DI272_00040 [Streptomyces sp. Act143]
MDEEGIQNLSMRRSGSRLAITAAALYWYIKSRHGLLMLAADTVWRETPLPVLDDREWRPALLTMAEHLRALCEASGLTGQDAEQAAQIVVTFAIGSALAGAHDPYVSFGLESILGCVEARATAVDHARGPR